MERIELNEEHKGILYELFEQLNASNISYDSAINVIEGIINDNITCQCESLNYGYGEPTCNLCEKIVDLNPPFQP